MATLGSTPSFPRRTLPVVVLAMIAIAMLAGMCGRGGSGTLLLAAQGSIVMHDVGSGAEKLVMAPVGGNGVVLRDPARSPDGARLAYVRAATSGGSEAATALWLAATDGRDPHPSIQRADVRVAHPQWLDDERVLAIVGTNTGVALERITAATGDRTVVIAGALDFGLSRDRTRVVYVKAVPEGTVVLFVADADGTNERALLGPEQRFAAITSPRLAPDGKSVAFAAPAPGAPATAPADIWSVDLAGGPARRIAVLQDPAPSLTFGADARALYAVSLRSLSEIDTTTGAVRRLRDNEDATTVEWFR